MKKLLLTILKIIGSIVAVVLLYVILALTLPLIPVAADDVSEPKTVEVFLLTNGVHTDIVVPVTNQYMDWRTEIPVGDTKAGSGNFKYLSVGWGDKGFYLDTPTWAELKVSTALKAAFWLSESAMHCTFYNKMVVGKDCKRILLTETQYRKLVGFIQNKFDRDPNGKPILIRTDAVYGSNDAFYDAKGSYSFLDTCNTWTNRGLKIAGQKAALWTASDFGIFYHYE